MAQLEAFLSEEDGVADLYQSLFDGGRMPAYFRD